MLKDIIYRRDRVDTSTTTNLLPFDFFGKYVPISLDVEDIFSVKGSVPTDGAFLPRRCFYLDDIDCYLLFDVADPHMAMLYLIDAKTRTTLTSYTYMLDTCPNYKLYDELVDMTVHHEPMDDTIRVTFLITNSELRAASLVSFKLTYQKLGELHNDTAGGPAFQLNLGDVVFFADIIPAGKEDEIALGYEMVTAHLLSGAHSWEYPEFNVGEIVPILKTQFHVGKFNNKYCNLTIDEKGRFVVLIGSRIKCWIGPHLSFPVDSQYIIIMDSRGMNQQFALLGPQIDAMSFDESSTHQPYKYSMTSWDGRYLLCLEDRKSRFLNPQRVFADAATDVPSDSYIFSDKAWDGGEIANRYYPARVAGATFTNSVTVTRVGYPTKWDQTSYEEPIHREAVWTVIDICDLFQDMEPIEPEPKPPYSADILFLVDDSGSMSGPMTQVQNNITAMISALSSLGVTDLRIGMALYGSTMKQIGDTSQGNVPAWATTQNGAISMAAQLRTGVTGPNAALGGYSAWPYSAIVNGMGSYSFRNIKAKFVVLVTDVAFPEYDPLSELDAMTALQGKGVMPYIVGTTPSLYSNIIAATNGSYTPMSGSWGSVLASDLVMLVASKAGATEEEPGDWYDEIAKAWQPTVFYNFMPEFDLMANSFITIYHDNMVLVANGSIIRTKLNYLTVFDDYPNLGGKPQDSFYLPGLIPGDPSKAKFVIRNESYTGTMKNLTLTLLDKPDDIEVVVKRWPNELGPRATAVIEIDATYTPTAGMGTVVKHLDAKYEVTYWMRHDLACSHVDETKVVTKASIPQLYFVEHPQDGLVAGYAKSIVFDPLYTLSFVTKTEVEEGDLVEQSGWKNKLYILTPVIRESEDYVAVNPVPLSSMAGHSTTEDGCCWLKARGPVRWITTRDYECKVNVKTWYLVNQSLTETYIAHVDMDSNTMPDMAETGFIVVDYPEGNIVPPGASIPVEFKWQPIFNPDGEQMTKELTTHKVMTAQDGAIASVLDVEPGLFNQILFNMAPTTDYNNAQFTHIYVENIVGDGRDVPVKPNQALRKMDVKDLKAVEAIYDTKSLMDVDTDTVQDGFQFVIPNNIWGGTRDDPSVNDVMLPLGAKPDDAFDYVEWLSSGDGLPVLPHYIDHKFQVNPDYTYHAEDDYPYQLAPFNKAYAKPYVGTHFVGDVTIKSNTVALTAYTDMSIYDDEQSPLIPCDASGTELAGWMLEDIWPVPGDWGSSVDILATEDDYIFKRTVYVKNRHSTDAFNVNLLYAASVVNGISIQGITFPDGTGLVNPGEVIRLEVSFRLHYTYQEAKYVNMVRDYLYIPRFDY